VNSIGNTVCTGISRAIIEIIIVSCRRIGGGGVNENVFRGHQKMGRGGVWQHGHGEVDVKHGSN